ncbi:Antitoxin HicB [Yersinia frederiksenii]|nr:Antitoxin HicB [Yersinia frederiksenii]
MFHYPASYTFDEVSGEYHIQYRDFPELESVTYSLDDIELEAQEGIKNGIAVEMEERRPIPAPSPLQAGDIAVHVSILVRLKAELHNAILATNTRKAEMARKLGLSLPQMDRLLNVDYASKVEVLEQALYLLGFEADIMVRKID